MGKVGVYGMKEHFYSGFTAGFLVGILLMAVFTIHLRDRGRDECNLHLPRTEQCIQVWVAPVKESK